MHRAKTGILACCFLGLALFIQAQSPGNAINYREIFGVDYENAVKTIEDNSWWGDSLQKDGIDARFALSIIFPELIRYSSISDYIEIKALEVLYVQYGHDYADFSIGLFQMKPTFAEQIEADVLKYHLPDSYPSLSALNPKTTDDTETRKARIIRLMNEYYQLLYLEAFIRIMEVMYPEMAAWPAEEKLGFYATAYNVGYYKGDKVIWGYRDKAYFYKGMNANAEKYNYGEIAVDYYSTLNIEH